LRVVTLILCCTIASCSCWAAPWKGEATVNNSDLVAEELRGCPLWTEVPDTDVTRRMRITEVYKSLAHYDNATIRNGILLVLHSYARDTGESYRAGEKIFAFLRVIFEVPSRFDASIAGLPYGIMGNPVNSDGLDLLWPFSLDRDGQLTLTGVALVFRSGPPYDPIADFDQMASRLPRRFR
jgi:hypothetical protein